jgi:DNA invertase Pin-like site-specific DNA recombinase
MIAIYVRVSSKQQDHRSQLPDLERWAAAQSEPVIYFEDKFTGRTMDRPGWKALQAQIESGKVSTVVVWRLDRLGRTAKGLTALFSDLIERKINLVSLKEGIDLGTPAGRLMAHVLSSVSQFETEVRAERIAAGQAAAKAAGKSWGGRAPGKRTKAIASKEEAIRTLKKAGQSVVSIAKALQISRPTVYAILKDTSGGV